MMMGRAFHIASIFERIDRVGSGWFRVRERISIISGRPAPPRRKSGSGAA
jgi:hypothetical protein